MILALLLDLIISKHQTYTPTAAPPPPPLPPMVCPACAGWGRERRQQGSICLLCDGQGSVAVREPVRP